MTGTVPPGLPEQLAGQAERIAAAERALADMSGLLDALRADLDELAGSESPVPYRPQPSPRLWELDEQGRAALADRLDAWVRQVYVPCYGHEAARLPHCWREHDYCLLMLDWLSELWACLYVPARRPAGVVSGQAEWQTRILPAAAAGMADEGARCAHRLGAGRSA